MHPDDYRRFTERLRERLAEDERVLGLVALGSMSGELPAPDEWSDHDFFVLTRSGEQERMRNQLGWLPDHEQIAFAYRETAHGVKVLYRSAHLLEFAVFDLSELELARINRYRTLLDRGGIEERMRALRERTARELSRPDPRWLAGQLVTSLLIGADRYRRGERLAGRARLQEAVRFLVQLLEPAPPDSLDPLRRFEQAFPALGRELDAALEQTVPEAAARLLAIARRELRDFPVDAARAVEDHLAGSAG
jgi:hypothetical protein